MTMTKEERRAKARAWRKAYDARPEVKAAREAYRKRDDVKAQRKAYNAQPTVKAATRARDRVYKARPDVKAKLQEAEFERYHNANAEQVQRRVTRAKEYNNKPITLEVRLRRLLGGIKDRIRFTGRSMANTVTYDDLLELYNAQGGKCALTGWELTPLKGHKNTMSLDRINGQQGYTVDNIQLVAAQANIAKNKWSEAEFIALCEAVVKRQQTAG